MARHPAAAEQGDGRYGITLTGRHVGIVSAVAVEAEPSPAEWQNPSSESTEMIIQTYEMALRHNQENRSAMLA